MGHSHASGTRISKTVGNNTTYYTHGASGNSEMETIVGSSSTTNRYYIWGLDHLGLIQSSARYYYIKDHLGSVRMIIDKNGKVKAYDDYYPFGLVMPGRSMNMAMADERYKFIGKEQDAETGYYMLGPRPFDSFIGRFLTPDPLQALFPGQSSYSYSLNNPIRFLDAGGMAPGDTVAEVLITANRLYDPDMWLPISNNIASNSVTYALANQNLRNQLQSEAEKQSVRDLIKSIITSIPGAEIHDLLDPFKGIANQLGDRATDKLQEAIDKITGDFSQNGVAITPEVQGLITQYVISLATSFVSSNNLIGPPDIINAHLHKNADTIFYDFKHSNYIMEVIQKDSTGDPTGHLLFTR